MEKEIADEIRRMKKKYISRNVFSDVMMLYILQKNQFDNENAAKQFDHIAKFYSMSDIIEISKIGRELRSIKKDKRLAFLLFLNKKLNENNQEFIMINFS